MVHDPRTSPERAPGYGEQLFAESCFIRAVPVVDRKRLHHSHTSREALSQVFCFGEQFCGELV